MAVSKKATIGIRVWLSSGRAPRPQGPLEALELAQHATTQGLAALLSAEGGAWPDSVRALLTEATAQARVRGAVQRQAGVSVSRALASLGVATLPLKGLATAGRLYDRLEHRPMRDVDLLLLEHPASLAEELALKGFRPAGTEPDHALVFRSPEGVEIELHRSLASPFGFHPLPASSLQARAQAGSDGLLEASSADLLAHLSLHAAFQHGLVLRLSQWLDFKRLLELEAPASQAALESLAEHGAASCAWAALQAERALFEDSRADPLIQALDPRIAPPLRRHLEARLADLDGLIEPARAPLSRARWLLAEGRRTKLLRATLAGSGLGPFSLANRVVRLARRFAVER